MLTCPTSTERLPSTLTKPTIRLARSIHTQLARCRRRRTSCRSESRRGNSIIQADASHPTADHARWWRRLFTLHWNVIMQDR